MPGDVRAVYKTGNKVEQNNQKNWEAVIILIRGLKILITKIKWRTIYPSWEYPGRIIGLLPMVVKENRVEVQTSVRGAVGSGRKQRGEQTGDRIRGKHLHLRLTWQIFILNQEKQLT
jgi:hypothetical protein